MNVSRVSPLLIHTRDTHSPSFLRAPLPTDTTYLPYLPADLHARLHAVSHLQI